MKKVLLSLLACGAFGVSHAEFTYPVDFESNFRSLYENQQSLQSAGWTTYGAAGTVDSGISQYFSGYSTTNAFSLLGWGSNVSAFTPSALTSNGAAVPSDQWLITEPITITEANTLISWMVVAYDNTARNMFKVLLSEGGVEKEDFNVEIVSSSLQGKSQEIASGSRRAVIQGYEGKTIRLAFVGYDNTKTMMGFGDIHVAPYYIEIRNAKELQHLVSNGDVAIPVTMRMSTPVAAKGFTAVLRTDDGYEATYTDPSTSFSKSKVSTVNFSFSGIDLPLGETIGYTLTITPNMEGASSSVFTGLLTNAKASYYNNAVVEEGTGSWCGWCPRGIAFMNYYCDTYNDLGMGKVIPLMLHSGDKMQVGTASEYTNAFVSYMQKNLEFPGYPYCGLNRKSGGDPSEIDVLGTIKSKTFSQLNILETFSDEGAAKEIKLHLGGYLTFDAEEFDAKLSVAVIENGVTGKNSEWNQQTYYGKYSINDIKAAYGNEIAKYFEKFVNRPSGYVPFTEMEYNEVARGIFPSFEGESILGSWTAETMKEMEITIPIPTLVNNIENVSVVAIMTNSNGEIIASDIMPYSEWNKPWASVKAANGNTLNAAAARNAEGLGIKTPCDAEVAVYTVDGKLLYNGHVRAGESTIALAKGQTVIVKVAAAAGNYTAKVVL